MARDGCATVEPTASFIDEKALFAELAIMEYFVHQSNVLRLESLLISIQPPHKERELGLRRAHYYSQLVLKQLESFKLYFANDLDIPFDDLLRKRLLVAKFIGLAFFSNQGRQNWNGEMSSNERKQTYELAYRTLLRFVDVSQAAVAQVALNMATQVYILNSKASILYEPHPNAIYRERLGHLLVTLDEATRKNENLEEKYPFSQFSHSIVKFLHEMYNELEQSLALRFCAQVFASENKEGAGKGEEDAVDGKIINEGPFITSKGLKAKRPKTHQASSTDDKPSSEEEEQTPSSNRSSIQMDFMTQLPADLMASPPQKTIIGQSAQASSKKDGTSQRNEDKENFKNIEKDAKEDVNNLKPDNHSLNVTIEASDWPPTNPALSDVGLRIAESSPIPESSQSISLNLSRVVDSTVKSTPILSNEEANSPIQLESSLKIIPPEAFRGHLCEDDDLLAQIISAQHSAVREFLSRPPRVSSAAPINATTTVKPSSLLDRHDSAERIIWSHSNSPEAQNEEAAYQAIISNSRKRRPWSLEEIECLIQGYRRFGNNWSKILSTFFKQLGHRTNVNLKDKARELIRKGILQ